jgi:hypothetical protein
MNYILLVAAIAISILVFTWLIKVVKATIGTAILVAAIVLILQLVFGIGPDQILQQISQLFQGLWHLIVGN